MARSKAKGRKVRNLRNGKMYTTKKQSISSKLRSQKALERVDCSLMMKCTEANSTPEAILKRVASMKRFLLANPDFARNKSKQMYRDHPELRQVRKEAIKEFQHLLGLPLTDPTMAKKVAFDLKYCKNGIQVLEYIECEREKTVGVTTY